MRRSVLLEIPSDDPTASDVLDHLLGTDQHDDTQYVVYKYADEVDRTFIQRFNALWVYPIFIASMPFQWLFTGRMGFSRHTKTGLMIDYLVGLDP